MHQRSSINRPIQSNILKRSESNFFKSELLAVYVKIAVFSVTSLTSKQAGTGIVYCSNILVTREVKPHFKEIPNVYFLGVWGVIPFFGGESVVSEKRAENSNRRWVLEGMCDESINRNHRR